MVSKNGLTMQLSITLSTKKMQISYRVQNSSGSSIGLFNRIMSTKLDDRPHFSTRSVYIDYEQPVLHLKKMVLPLPEGLAMSELILPLVSILENGEEFVEKFILPVPVAVCNPLDRAILAAANPKAAIVANDMHDATAIRFSLGLFKVDQIPNVQLLPFSPAFPTIFRVWPPGPAVDKQIILTDKIALDSPISVGVYDTIS